MSSGFFSAFKSSVYFRSTWRRPKKETLKNLIVVVKVYVECRGRTEAVIASPAGCEPATLSSHSLNMPRSPVPPGIVLPARTDGPAKQQKSNVIQSRRSEVLHLYLTEFNPNSLYPIHWKLWRILSCCLLEAQGHSGCSYTYRFLSGFIQETHGFL